MSKQSDFVDEIKASRNELEALLNQFTDAEMVRPVLPGNWSIKDLLAHFGWWATRATNLYDILARGETPPSEEITLDQLNAQAYTENQNRALDDVRHSERETYQRLLNLASQAPEDDLFNPNRFSWTQGNAFVNWIASNSAGHYAEHTGDLKAWLTANKPQRT